MKIARIQWREEISYAVVEDKRVRALVGLPFLDVSYSGREMQLCDVTLLAPCQPTKVIAVGLNYRKHIDEVHMETPKEPLIFLKPSTSVIGNNEPIFYPELSKQVDFEAELAVVIGRQCRFVRKEEAKKYIFGYTCLNDVTARDLQSLDKQWTRSKSFDTFCPIGPWIETDMDWRGREVKATLNGEVKQCGSTDDMLFGVEELVSHISQVMTLEPGDVIATGTPSGIGPMQRGDKIRVSVSGIGELENVVV